MLPEKQVHQVTDEAKARMLRAAVAQAEAIANDGGRSGLMAATLLGGTELVRRLIDQGLDVNKENAVDETALMWTVQFGQNECIHLLTDRGADLDKTCGKSTAVDFVDGEKYPETMRLQHKIAEEKKARVLHKVADGRQQRLNRLAKKSNLGGGP